VIFGVLRVKVRDEGVPRSKAGYLALRMDLNGTKDAFGVRLRTARELSSDSA